MFVVVLSNWIWIRITEMKDWHQKFLQIVLRNLLNWCECVGRKNLNNVLYPFIESHSLSISTSYEKTNLITTTVNWIFSFIQMLQEFWNDLWDVRTIMFLWGSRIKVLEVYHFDLFWSHRKLWFVRHFLKHSIVVSKVDANLSKRFPFFTSNFW
jgi:hypothetical protein